MSTIKEALKCVLIAALIIAVAWAVRIEITVNAAAQKVPADIEVRVDAAAWPDPVD